MNLDRSIEEFNHSGDEAAARNNLGLILLKRGQIAESLEQFRLAARMRPYYKEAVANYRMARDLNFQRQREARTTLRSVEQELAMATTPGVFGLAGIADTGLGLLSDDLHLLAGQPPLPRPEKPTVTVDIETGQSYSADDREFGGLLGSGFRLGRVLVVPDRLKKTILRHGNAEAAVELAHRFLDIKSSSELVLWLQVPTSRFDWGSTSSGNQEREPTPKGQ